MLSFVSGPKSILTHVRTRARHHYNYFHLPAAAARRAGSRLLAVLDKTRHIRKSDILAFLAVRNDQVLIAYFLDYYRRLGVGHFLIVDHSSSDVVADHATSAKDCSLWRTGARDSDSPLHALNHLQHRYGIGQWCLAVDPDEFLVFPHCEHRTLPELIGFLESEHRDHLFCLMLDMYGQGTAGETHYKAGQNPLDAAPYFDRLGYVQKPDASYGDTVIQGGPRRRMIYAGEPGRAPLLNRVPLIRWGKSYNYLSQHLVAPKRLNRPHFAHHLTPTGCLLHFPFLTHEGAKVGRDLNGASPGIAPFCEISEQYRDSRQLAELGLMSFGQWF